MHLIELVSLTKIATRRMEVEAVRVQADLRGQRIGDLAGVLRLDLR